MRDHDLPILSNLFVGEGRIESKRLIVEALKKLPEMPTAFICAHDVIAYDLIHALSTKGLRCPEDVSIVGFDNVQTVEVQSLNLTTYFTPHTTIAQTTIDLLHSQEAPRRIQLFGELIERGSIRDIR